MDQVDAVADGTEPDGELAGEEAVGVAFGIGRKKRECGKKNPVGRIGEGPGARLDLAQADVGEPEYLSRGGREPEPVPAVKAVTLRIAGSQMARDEHAERELEDAAWQASRDAEKDMRTARGMKERDRDDAKRDADEKSRQEHQTRRELAIGDHKQRKDDVPLRFQRECPGWPDDRLDIPVEEVVHEDDVGRKGRGIVGRSVVVQDNEDIEKDQDERSVVGRQNAPAAPDGEIASFEDAVLAHDRKKEADAAQNQEEVHARVAEVLPMGEIDIMAKQRQNQMPAQIGVAMVEDDQYAGKPAEAVEVVHPACV